MRSLPILRSVRGVLTLGVALALAACGSGDAPDNSGTPTFPDLAPADTSAAAVVGQTIYVPAYSHILTQDGRRELDLTVTLSLRNTDPAHALTIADVSYHDSDGRRVRRYADQPFRLAPLASQAFVVGQRDRTGGVGASFIVEWTAADADVSAPIAEAVMVSTASGQGISLVSRGHVVRTLDRGLLEPPPDSP